MQENEQGKNQPTVLRCKYDIKYQKAETEMIFHIVKYNNMFYVSTININDIVYNEKTSM